MNRGQPIHLTSGEVAQLLAGEAVSVTHRGGVRRRGESYPVVLREVADVRVVVVSNQADEKTSRRAIARGRNPDLWTLKLQLDTAEPPYILRAESQTAIDPLGSSYNEDDPAAHGYIETAAQALDDAGEAIDPEAVASTAASQESAHRFTAQKVDILTQRRARSMANRVRDALMQARAHGVDVSQHVTELDALLKDLNDRVREAA